MASHFAYVKWLSDRRSSLRLAYPVDFFDGVSASKIVFVQSAARANTAPAGLRYRKQRDACVWLSAELR